MTSRYLVFLFNLHLAITLYGFDQAWSNPSVSTAFKFHLPQEMNIFLRTPIITFSLLISVSIGGSTGLFVGASLLSFIELIYYFTIRPYVNYRNEQRQQQQKKPSSIVVKVHTRVGGGRVDAMEAPIPEFKWLDWNVELISWHSVFGQWQHVVKVHYAMRIC